MRLIWNFDFYNIVYFFTVYSFLGWCIEVAYYYKNERRFVNRGFLNGPFCPIYGCSIVSIIIFLNKFKTNILILFLLGFVFTSLVEYITSFLLEKIFNDKWWDYSDDPLNIHGRVCVPYSLLWATGVVIVIEIIHPVVNTLIDKIPSFPGIILFYILIIYFLLDFSFTLASLVKKSISPPHFELAFNKPSLNSTLRAFGDVIEHIKFSNKKFIDYFYPMSFSQILNTLKRKLKKD